MHTHTHPRVIPHRTRTACTDDMGIDQIKVPAAQRRYGYTGNNGTINTPAISRLAAEGMVFQVCIYDV